MIFLANVLVMNGGSTFLVRTSREMKRQGEPVAVLLLRREVDQELLSQLKESATVFYLEDFLYDKAYIFRAHLGVFGFVAWERLERALIPYGVHVHVMGVFGLLFGYRLCTANDKFRLTAGIYHQNEFLYRNVDSYFTRKVFDFFRALPSENVVFFNDTSRDNYIDFFAKDFSTSLIVPIGIELTNSSVFLFDSDAFRIVSIGNLVKFKTYNEHIIRALPYLLKKYPDLKYDIYGNGANEAFLRGVVDDLCMNDVVRFHGEIEYSKMRQVLGNSTLFVGSGTAIIEAASLGIPGLIGIESIKTSETYGFISDAQGFSYNEDVSDVKKFSFLSLLDVFFENRDLRIDLSRKCKIKAQSFSVENTVQGFLSMKPCCFISESRISPLVVFKMFISLIYLGARQFLFSDTCFADRRNQSY